MGNIKLGSTKTVDKDAREREKEEEEEFSRDEFEETD